MRNFAEGFGEHATQRCPECGALIKQEISPRLRFGFARGVCLGMAVGVALGFLIAWL
jgi:hypothetical protein